MAAIGYSQPVKGARHHAQRARHIAGLGAGGLHPGEQLNLGQFRLARPVAESIGVAAVHLKAFFQMIVEHHIADAELFHRRDQARDGIDQMGFRPDLHPQIDQRGLAELLHGGHDGLGMVGAAKAAFPAPALGEEGGGHAMRRSLTRGGGKAIHQGKGGRRAGKDLPFKAIAVQVDDAGQQPIPRHVHLCPDRLIDDLAMAYANRACGNFIAGQDIRADKAQGGQEGGHGTSHG